ncbi:MAG: hypothetical protein AAF721_27695 [Myxococcota bacterium]
MGLAERRAIKKFEDEHFPKYKEQIDAVAGFDVEVHVEWGTLAADDYAHLYDEALPKVYFEPVIEALREICIDELGKDALREGLRRVDLKWSGSKRLGFEGGVLTVDHSPVSNLDYVDERKRELQKALEKSL